MRASPPTLSSEEWRGNCNLHSLRQVQSLPSGGKESLFRRLLGGHGSEVYPPETFCTTERESPGWRGVSSLSNQAMFSWL